MAANNRGAIRPNGRSPPFLAIGLTVALVILGFNYWSLSARNGEQSNEIAVLESEMRLMNAKKISAEKRSEAIADKVKELEDELGKQKSVIADKMAQLTNLNAEKDAVLAEKEKFETEAHTCTIEKLPGCTKEKEDLQLQFDEIKEALENEKNNPKETICDESKCSEISRSVRQKLLDDLKRVLGAGPMVSLYQNGINLGNYETEIQQIADQGHNAGQPIVGSAQNFFQQQQRLQQQPQFPQIPGQLAQQPQGLAPVNADNPEQNAQVQQPDPAALEQKIADQQAKGAQPPQDPNAGQESNLPQVPNPNDGIMDQEGAKPAFNEENKAETDVRGDTAALDADAPDNNQEDQAKNLTKPPLAGTLNMMGTDAGSGSETQSQANANGTSQVPDKEQTKTTVTKEPPLKTQSTDNNAQAKTEQLLNTTSVSGQLQPASAKHMVDDRDYDGDEDNNDDADYDDDDGDELKVMPNDKGDLDDYDDEDNNDYDNDWLKPDDDELDDIAAQDKNIDEMQARLVRDAQQ